MARVAGPSERLGLRARLIGNGRRMMQAELEAALLPRDLEAFAVLSAQGRATVDALLVLGRAMVEAVERLVCRLSDLPPDLEEAVVAHAVKRAAAGMPDNEA